MVACIEFFLENVCLVEFSCGKPHTRLNLTGSKLIKIHWIKDQIEWVDQLWWCLVVVVFGHSQLYNSQGYLSEEEKSQGYLSHFESTQLRLNKRKNNENRRNIELSTSITQ